MLRDYGRLSVRDVLEPAIYYAEHGHPLLPRVADTIKRAWPTSSRRNGRHPTKPGCRAAAPPQPHANFRNPVLAETWKRVIAEAEAKRGREAQVEAARDAFYRGFVAEAIHDLSRQNAEVMDASGSRHKGVLTADDMANWSATIEAPLTYDYHGWTVAKIGPWGQGPVLPADPGDSQRLRSRGDGSRLAPISSTPSPKR